MDGLGTTLEAMEAKREQYRWKPRQFSYGAVGLLIVGTVAMVLAVFTNIIAFNPETLFSEIFALIYQYSDMYIYVAIALIVGGIVSELTSRYRVPPPAWRVRVELERTLIDLGVLDGEDKRRWRGMWWCSPFGKYDRKAKLYTLKFDCRTVKNKQEVYAQLEQSIAGFHRCQDAAIEVYKKKGKRKCMQLLLWYTESPYEKGLEDVAPW